MPPLPRGTPASSALQPWDSQEGWHTLLGIYFFMILQSSACKIAVCTTRYRLPRADDGDRESSNILQPAFPSRRTVYCNIDLPLRSKASKSNLSNSCLSRGKTTEDHPRHVSQKHVENRPRVDPRSPCTRRPRAPPTQEEGGLCALPEEVYG